MANTGSKHLASLTYTVIAVYVYVFMEWLFFVTQISFMSTMTFLEQIRVPFLAGLTLLLPLALFSLFNFLMRVLIPVPSIKKIFDLAAVLIPVLIFSCLALILSDNFTYTLLGFGVVSTEGWERIFYVILFFLFFVFIYKAIGNSRLFQKTEYQHSTRKVVYFALSLVVVSMFVWMSESPWKKSDVNLASKSLVKNANVKLPNILLLSTDGLNSSHMSLFEYQRKTTPNIEQYAQKALVSGNAFANAGATGGSLISLLTGKSTITTRMHYPPDILFGVHSYQHFPGILKKLGYRTVQLTDPYHADAYSRNLLSGFDEANSRSEERFILSRIIVSRYIGDGSSAYFVSVMIERIMERFQHFFFLKKMDNPYKIVTEPAVSLSEQEKLKRVLELLEDSEQPTFIQVHMLGTHGPQFMPSIRKFSEGQTQESDWMIDFYDDSILNFDHDLGFVFQSLDQIGQLSNTVIVVYSDHGMDWKSEARIPLLFWFPDGEYKGTINQNVQLLDVAPTLLNYLGVQKPEWMEGESLLKDLTQRYIFSTNPADSIKVKMNNGLYEGAIVAPFYQLGVVTMIACNKWYKLNLKMPEFKTGKVAGSTSSCDENTLPSADDAKLIIQEQLKISGYDISKIPKQVPR